MTTDAIVDSTDHAGPFAAAPALSPIPVMLVGTSYPTTHGDWKGIFIRQMVESLARREDIRLHTWCPPGPMPANVRTAWIDDDARWLLRLMERGGIAHLLRKNPLLGLKTALGLMWRLRRSYASSDASLFHLNWLQNVLTLPNDRRPLLVTALGTDMQLLRLPLMRSLLLRKFAARRTVLCPNAAWMVAPLANAFGDVADIRYVPLGIDSAWFRIERSPAPDGIHRWICVSRLTSGKLGPLFEWCAPHFSGRERELHLFGPMQEQITVPDWVHYHGAATPEQLREEWFPRATGLITLSRHAEGRPQVMLEAMAAGLPILASRLPAHEDIVSHSITGWLCDDSTTVSSCLDAGEDLAYNSMIGSRAREWCRSETGDWDDCAARYCALYRTLLTGEEQ
ncbi:glycosyltransferase family 4 protein [Pseudoxanthomonas sacheonensis]|uniref:Glycosyltransferase involved in cell wall biosynthesis n=1 Tax=Pseudoxanthomonas sacheonensis TaxID=443615 RepID=A0ABU1RWF9_9GAMM|nr:glycosyltransferase family 4 protein [Pseudoxanthomonas sacheonensis]MDR6843112.1 glycosyltransferase involved in cell wall biosynthesis [Pseudoxanthomonas sacheonensis]